MELARTPSNRRLLLAVLCLLSAIVAVQLLDPFATPVDETATSPPSDATPPERLRYAFDSLNDTAHTMTIFVVDGQTQRRFSYLAVNYTERELYIEFGDKEHPQSLYFYADGAWVKPPKKSWQNAGLFDRSAAFTDSLDPSPFRSAAVTADRTTVHNSTAESLWIRVNGSAETATPCLGTNDTYTLYELDPETNRLRRAIEYNASTDTVRVRYEIDAYETTTVTQPQGTKRPLVNLLSDLLR